MLTLLPPNERPLELTRIEAMLYKALKRTPDGLPTERLLNILGPNSHAATLYSMVRRANKKLQAIEERIEGRYQYYVLTSGSGMRSAKHFTGKPCKRGHTSERYASGGCVECYKIKRRQRCQ